MLSRPAQIIRNSVVLCATSKAFVLFIEKFCLATPDSKLLGVSNRFLHKSLVVMCRHVALKLVVLMTTMINEKVEI